MNSELSQLEKNILGIRMKLYSVQSVSGFDSREAEYVRIIADECVEILRKASGEKTLELCNKKMENALDLIGFKQNV